MKFKEFILKVVSANSGISSKRVCGIIGWIVCLIIVIQCTVTNTEAPTFADSIIIASSALLGVDSITNIWKKV